MRPRTQYRCIKRENQLIRPDGVARQTISVALLFPLYQQINETAIAAGKSQARIVNELLEAGLQATKAIA